MDYTGELEPPEPLSRLPQLKHRMKRLLTQLGKVQQISLFSSTWGAAPVPTVLGPSGTDWSTTLKVTVRLFSTCWNWCCRSFWEGEIQCCSHPLSYENMNISGKSAGKIRNKYKITSYMQEKFLWTRLLLFPCNCQPFECLFVWAVAKGCPVSRYPVLYVQKLYIQNCKRDLEPMLSVGNSFWTVFVFFFFCALPKVWSCHNGI